MEVLQGNATGNFRERQVVRMQDETRVNLILTWSGQVVPVRVPDSTLEWIARRNYEIMLSLRGKNAVSVYEEQIRRLQPYPS